MWITTYEKQAVNLAHAQRIYIKGVPLDDSGLRDCFDVRADIDGLSVMISNWDTKEEAEEVIRMIAADLQGKTYVDFWPTNGPPRPSRDIG